MRGNGTRSPERGNGGRRSGKGENSKGRENEMKGGQLREDLLWDFTSYLKPSSRNTRKASLKPPISVGPIGHMVEGERMARDGNLV